MHISPDWEVRRIDEKHQNIWELQPREKHELCEIFCVTSVSLMTHHWICLISEKRQSSMFYEENGPLRHSLPIFLSVCVTGSNVTINTSGCGSSSSSLLTHSIIRKTNFGRALVPKTAVARHILLSVWLTRVIAISQEHWKQLSVIL